MSYTAKSVILDCADNWGAPYYLGVRSIDFWFEGSKIANLQTTDSISYAANKS